MINKTYQIDPDFRPKIPHGCTAVRCARCQKIIKNVSTAIRGTTDETGFEFTVDPNGKQLLGSDCWKIVVDNGYSTRYD